MTLLKWKHIRLACSFLWTHPHYNIITDSIRCNKSFFLRALDRFLTLNWSSNSSAVLCPSKTRFDLHYCAKLFGFTLQSFTFSRRIDIWDQTDPRPVISLSCHQCCYKILQMHHIQLCTGFILYSREFPYTFLFFFTKPLLLKVTYKSLYTAADINKLAYVVSNYFYLLSSGIWHKNDPEFLQRRVKSLGVWSALRSDINQQQQRSSECWKCVSFILSVWDQIISSSAGASLRVNGFLPLVTQLCLLLPADTEHLGCS